MELPEELLVHVFSFLDASSYNKVRQVSKYFDLVANSPLVWDSIFSSYLNPIRQNEEVSPWLPSSDDIEGVDEKDKKSMTSIELQKRTYRIMSTCFIIIPKKDKVSPDDIQNIVTKATSHHTILRKVRVYEDFNDALKDASAGDYIYISAGEYAQEFVVSKPVHLIGTRNRQVNKSHTEYILRSTLTSPIVWNASEELYPGQIGSITHCRLINHAQVNVIDSKLLCYRLIIAGVSKFNLLKGASLLMKMCDFIGGGERITIEDPDVYLNVKDAWFESNTIGNSVFQLILEKFQKSIDEKNNSMGIALANTIASIISINRRYHMDCLKDCEHAIVRAFESFIDIFYMDGKSMEEMSVNLYILTRTDGVFREILSNASIVDTILKVMRNHPEIERIQIQLAYALNKLLDNPRCRQYFGDREIYKVLFHNLEVQHTNKTGASAILSLLWNCSHFLMTLRPLLISSLPVVMKVLSMYKDDERMYKNTMGMVWNLPGSWPKDVTKAIVPHLPCALRLATSHTSLQTMLGAFLVVIPNASKEDIDYLVSVGTVQLLLEIKNKDFDSSNDKQSESAQFKREAEHRLWKAITWLSSNIQAQQRLKEMISNEFTFPPLSEIDRALIIRTLTVCTTEAMVVNALHTIGSTTTSAQCFFIIMDGLGQLLLVHPKSVSSSSVQQVGRVIIERSKLFTLLDRKIKDWMGWIRALLKGELLPISSYVCMDISKRHGIHVSETGLLCKHDFSMGWGSVISNYGVKSGKWCYEVTMLSTGSLQIGWVTSQFKANPDEGVGVGDDRHGWSVDFHRRLKWHQDENGNVNEPYGKGVKCVSGGIVQCFLDADNGTIEFGYNGINCSVAFSGIDSSYGFFAGLSTNVENECLFNFSSMIYNHDGYLPLNDILLPMNRHHLFTISPQQQ
eukprot:TRINITY_DN6578_c0_g1_i1.p1 TRINITY_DN6578_c0_g1~~TRINITY_DN6578_c0_g1_i1.p1  ORF type:complete len:908 (+),score=180.36 TRINITY_DN6578_c0_g1_i1:17-2740(+)